MLRSTLFIIESDEELRKAERQNKTGAVPTWKVNHIKDRAGIETPKESAHKKFSKMVDAIKKAHAGMDEYKLARMRLKSNKLGSEAKKDSNTDNGNWKKLLTSKNRIDLVSDPHLGSSTLELSDKDKDKLVRRGLMHAIRLERSITNYDRALGNKSFDSAKRHSNLISKLHKNNKHKPLKFHESKDKALGLD